MPSNSLNLWLTNRRRALDQIAAAHAAVGGTGPGRRYATQQINQAYAMMVSSQFQGYCRDLHSEAVDYVCGPVGAGDARLDLLPLRLTTGRKLDAGNPNPANLGNDFGLFDFRMWDAMKYHDPVNEHRQRVLEHLNTWRNAIAHQDFDPAKLGGRVTVRLDDVRRWRRACDELAVEMDVVVGARVGTITGAQPW